ncbi:MAG: peptidoglycan DD-metalloendopeptidase family protein [Oscillibacter sp.]|jgi:murein DD-endopeptidase MepM/ murein hydrolase activator NlpD|nr:peptidoglycan DD-metalloendopeptidase family protein [Oscillibacter sp.]
MEKNFKSILSGGGFYAVLAVCLLAAGVGGWLMLRQDAAPVIEDPPAAAGGPVLETAGEEGPSVQDLYIADNEAEKETPASAPAVIPEPEPVSMPEEPVDNTPVMAEAPRLIVSPLNGEILAAFSVDELAYNPTMGDWRTHDGVDISAKPGTTVLAASSGTVSAVTDDPMMGTTVVIEHDGGYQTTYANLQDTPTVVSGDEVSAGQIIGAVGTTASAESAQSPHLHFSVSKNGTLMDPDEFLNQ